MVFSTFLAFLALHKTHARGSDDAAHSPFSPARQASSRHAAGQESGAERKKTSTCMLQCGRILLTCARLLAALTGGEMRGLAWSTNRSFRRAGGVSGRPVGGLVKRGFDIGGASLALVFFSPILLLLAVLIAFADGGPVFQSHLRIGRGGCVFNCLRFRTTTEGMDGWAAMHLRPPRAAGGAGTGSEPSESDRHLTATGAVLTRLGLADLPQLINVLRGDMSIVGPRPLAPTELERLGNAAEFYLNARPGLTGPWRLGAWDEASHAHQRAAERLYAENWSLLKDLDIIVRSVSAAAGYRRERA